MTRLGDVNKLTLLRVIVSLESTDLLESYTAPSVPHELTPLFVHKELRVRLLEYLQSELRLIKRVIGHVDAESWPTELTIKNQSDDRLCLDEWYDAYVGYEVMRKLICADKLRMIPITIIIEQ